jgi:hypothetical protein
LISLGLFICSLYYPQVQRDRQDDKQQVDVEAFLQKIRDILKEIEERAKQLEKKKKDKAQKQEIRKKIIEKLSNPFSRLKHKEIKVKRPEELLKTQSARQEHTYLQKNTRILQRQINTFFYKNPNFATFKLSTFRDALKKLGIQKSESIKPEGEKKEHKVGEDLTGELSLKHKAIEYLYQEVMRNLRQLWWWNWKILGSPQKFSYVRNSLCENEVSSNVNNPDEIFRQIGYGEKKSVESLLVSELTGIPYKNEVSSFSELHLIFPDRYKLYSGLSFSLVWEWNKNFPLPYDWRKSICYNISIFVLNGDYLLQTNKDVEALNLCYEELKKGVSPQSCNKVTFSTIQKAYKVLNNYINSASTLFKKVIFPTYLKLCYVKCMCQEEGIPCQKGQKRSDQENLKENLQKLIAIAAYDSYRPFFAMLDGFYYTSEKTVNLLNENNCSIENPTKLGERIKGIVEGHTKTKREKSQALYRVLRYLQQNDFALAFLELRREELIFLYELFTLKEFISIVDEFKKYVEDLKHKALITQNFCALVMVAHLALFTKDEMSRLKMFKFLAEHNLDGVLFLLYDISMGPIFTGNENIYDINDILTKLLNLPIAIYKIISIHKLLVCGYSFLINQTTRKNVLEYFIYSNNLFQIVDCVRKDSSLSVKCLFPFNKVMQQILEKIPTSINDIYNLVETLDGKKPIDYSSDFKELCENKDNIACYKLTNPFFGYNIENVLQPLCLNNLYERLPKHCPPKNFKECAPQKRQTGEYCYTQVVSSLPGQEQRFYSIVVDEDISSCWQNQSCKCNAECFTIFNTIARHLSGLCCNTDNDLQKLNLSIDKLCGYLTETITGCCKVLKSENGFITYEMVRSFTNNMSFCSEGISSEKIKEKVEWEIKQYLKDSYLQVLKEQLKNIVSLIDKKDTCPIK